MNDRRIVREGNSTADRALAILEMFSHEQPTLSARQLASGLGVARSTAYRYLQTLVSAGYLSESPEGGFRLGAKVIELAQVAQGRNNLVDMAIPEMESLAERFGQTVLLTKLVAGTILCVEQVDDVDQFVRLSYRRGKQMALNAGASALVCVAWLSDAEIRSLVHQRPLARISDDTIDDLGDLLERLEQVRHDGYVVTRGEVDLEGMGIAVPVFAPDGAVIAGLSVVGLQSRIQSASVPGIVEALQRSALVVSGGVSLYGA